MIVVHILSWALVVVILVCLGFACWLAFAEPDDEPRRVVAKRGFASDFKTWRVDDDLPREWKDAA